MWRFPKTRVPQSSSILVRLSITKTIQLLGVPRLMEPPDITAQQIHQARPRNRRTFECKSCLLQVMWVKQCHKPPIWEC